MVETYTNQSIAKIFQEIDQDQDGLISRQELQNTQYAQTLFDNSAPALDTFSCLKDGKMNLKDFTLLAYAKRYGLIDLAFIKFQVEKYLKKYLTVSAPGQAAPSLKQSFVKLKAYNHEKSEQKLHSIGVEFGVDKPHQETKIKQISEVFGHQLHQVFFLIKFSTPKNGQQIAKKLQQLMQTTFEILKGLAPEAGELITALRSYAKYANNYVYVVIEVDNPFVDQLISFATEVVQAISPQCAFKFKAKLDSNLGNLLTENFEYTKSGGQALLEFDIDHVTLKKLKEILGNKVSEQQNHTPPRQIFALLLEEVKVSSEFKNLGQAIAQTLNIQVEEIPKPYSKLQFIKELNIKETLGQLYEGGPDLLELISSSSQSQGQVSVNLHDFFLKISYDVHIEKVFQLLGSK